jgi:serine phosphatase RsbU (regulator of sigma subunit)
MADCYAATGNFRKAYEYQRKLIAVKDSVLHETGSKQVAEMAARYESEKKELEIQNLNKDNALKQQQLREQEIVARQQSLWIILIIGALLLMSTLAVVVYRSYRLKKQSAEIISDQKLQAERQRDLLEEKNTEITDSIYYAGRIQKALLASEAMLERNLPSYFVYYKPKDIVSGDFYWATEADGKFWLCVADCTGHGVPGAFMSLLNINFLNEAVIEKKISSPDQVLNHVRSRIISSLNPEGAAEAGRDGMDAALCMFDFKGGWLRFSCANNPLWLFRNGEMKVFAADKMPVGVHHGDQKPFTLSTLGLRKNDTIYLFSDGYADQFGGERGKKFKYKNMQRLFSEVSHLAMNEQRNRIEEVMNSWMQGMEQVDDILVIGIRV